MTVHGVTRMVANDAWARAGGLASARSPHGPWEVDRDAHGRIEACDIGNVRLARIRVNPLCIEEPGNAGSDRYRVLIQISGRSALNQAGHEILLEAGDWTVYRSGVPFTLWNIERSEQRLVILPPAQLWSCTPELQTLAVRRFNSSTHSLHLARFLDSAFETAAVYGDASAPDLASVAVHLARLALVECAGLGTHSLRADVMRSRIRGYVGQHLHDSTLTVPGIAAALNCSTRYLHKVFADGDETIAEYILRRRLERCFAELARPALPGRSIAELAYAAGFKSLSHFGQAFVERFGMTPGQRRRLSVAAASPPIRSRPCRRSR